MKVAEIRSFFETYINNMQENVELDEALYKTEDREEWFAQHSVRSQSLRRMFEENSAMLTELFDFLQNNELTDETAAAILQGMEDMYLNDCDDYDMLLRLVDILLPFYEKADDVDAIVLLCTVAAYEHIEFERRLVDSKYWHDCRKYQFRIRELRTRYSAELKESTRIRFFSNYFNLCVIQLFGEEHLWRESFELLQEMDAFWKSDLVQTVDKENETIQKQVEKAKTYWVGACCDNIPTEENAFAFFKDRVEKLYKIGLAELKENGCMQKDSFYAYTMLQLQEGTISPQDAVQRMFEAYVNRTEYLTKNVDLSEPSKRADLPIEVDEAAEYLVDISSILVQIINRYHVDVSGLQDKLMYVADNLIKNWNLIALSLPPTNIDVILARDLMALLEYVQDDDVRMKFFDTILMRRYIFNYIHFDMVARIARAIGDAMLSEKPELFAGTFGYTKGGVILHRAEIADYIYKAAKYHDIGKIQIGRVIETQYRKLSDMEFNQLRVHPALGVQIAEKQEFVKPYHDVILGHHKFYNGQGGYPAEFDNTKSDVRPIIDLITLCDCMDAATDRLGRNYAPGKTVEEVMEEFERDKGVRYNPDMVDYIHGNKALLEQLVFLTGEGRKEICYDIYDNQF